MNTLLFDHINTLYMQNENRSNAEVVRAYLKNHFGSFGIKHPERRKLDQIALRKYGLPDKDTYEKLFQQHEREFHHFSLEALFKDKKNWTTETIDLIEWMILHKSWWDSVDHIATKHCHYYFERFPEIEEPIVERWNKDKNIWLNRVSIIYQIKRKNEINLDRFYRSILPHTKSKEFFIQKAIGWALRDASRYHANWVISLCENTSLMPLSKREALRLLQ